MESKLNTLAVFYLKIPDGTVYGPVDIFTLCIWATDARVIPGCMVSETQDSWVPVETIPELRLNWSVHLADGTIYGPLNLLALRLLALEKSIPAGAGICERNTGRKAILNDSIIPLIEEEFRQMLTACGTMMSTAAGTLRDARQEAEAEAEARGDLLEELKAKLERTEADLARSMVVAADYGAKFVVLERTLGQQREQIGKEIEGHTARFMGEKEAILDQLKAAQTALQIKTTRLNELEADVVQGKTEVSALLAKVISLEGNLGDKASREKALSEQLVKMKEESQKVLEESRARFQEEAQKTLLDKEAVIQKLSSELVHHKTQAERQASDLLAKAGALERDLKDKELRVRTLCEELARAREETQKALSDERAIILEETQNALQEKDQLIRKLKSELQSQAESAAIKEKDDAAKLKQIEADVRASTELVAKTMQELELRERQLRELRQKEKRHKREPLHEGRVVEAEVIQAEVVHAETVVVEGASDKDALAIPVEPEPGSPRGKAAKSGILNSVEAQLQMELRKWEALKREQKAQKRSSPKWF